MLQAALRSHETVLFAVDCVLRQTTTSAPSLSSHLSLLLEKGGGGGGAACRIGEVNYTAEEVINETSC